MYSLHLWKRLALSNQSAGARLAYTLIFIFFMAYFPPAGSEIYQGVDEEGRIYYSDRPISGNEEIRPVQAGDNASVFDNTASRKAKRTRLLDIYEEERTQQKLDQQARRKEAQEREKKCLRRQAAYQRATRLRSIYRKTGDPDNPRYYLSDEERASYIQSLQERMKAACG